MAGSALADHELGPAPSLAADESAGKVNVVLKPECPIGLISYRTEDDGALAGQDYVHVEGTLNTSPWQFEVPILEDSADEGSETILVRISSVGHEAGGDGLGGNCVASINQTRVGTLTIMDNDGPASAASASGKKKKRSASTPRSPLAPDESLPDTTSLLDEAAGPAPPQGEDSLRNAPSKLPLLLAVPLLVSVAFQGFRRFRPGTHGSNQEPGTVVTEGLEGEDQ